MLPHIAYEFLVLCESSSFLIHLCLKQTNLFDTFGSQMLLLFNKLGNLAENIEARAL